MSKVKVAVVGAGHIANKHLDSYLRIENAEIAAICDINQEQLNKTANKYGIKKCYTNIDTMLAENPELDAADICVWNNCHAECAIKALEAGLDVLCEKPMACNAFDATKMLECAKKNNKLLMNGFMMRFSDRARIAKDFIENDYLGDIYCTRAKYIRRHGNPGGWFAEKACSGGGPVIDIGVHVLDLARWLMGNPKPVSVYAATFNKLGWRENLKTHARQNPRAPKDGVCDVEDFATALIRYENGAVTMLETSFSLNDEECIQEQIMGTKAGLDISDGVKLITECNDFLADINIRTENYKYSNNPFDEELGHFINCVKGIEECKINPEDGVEIMRIIDAIYLSAKTGHEVIL